MQDAIIALNQQTYDPSHWQCTKKHFQSQITFPFQYANHLKCGPKNKGNRLKCWEFRNFQFPEVFPTVDRDYQLNTALNIARNLLSELPVAYVPCHVDVTLLAKKCLPAIPRICWAANQIDTSFYVPDTSIGKAPRHSKFQAKFLATSNFEVGEEMESASYLLHGSHLWLSSLRSTTCGEHNIFRMALCSLEPL